MDMERQTSGITISEGLGLRVAMPDHRVIDTLPHTGQHDAVFDSGAFLQSLSAVDANEHLPTPSDQQLQAFVGSAGRTINDLRNEPLNAAVIALANSVPAAIESGNPIGETEMQARTDAALVGLSAFNAVAQDRMSLARTSLGETVQARVVFADQARAEAVANKPIAGHFVYVDVDADDVVSIEHVSVTGMMDVPDQNQPEDATMFTDHTWLVIDQDGAKIAQDRVERSVKLGPLDGDTRNVVEVGDVTRQQPALDGMSALALSYVEKHTVLPDIIAGARPSR